MPSPSNLPLAFAAWPHRLSGVVYGCLLNHRPLLAALGDAVNAAPYKAPPKAPVLYLKPRNTQVGPGARVALPADAPALEVGVSLGLVIGRAACRVSAATALDHVAGALLVADLCLPHDSYYRPSVRLRARDGFCPLGERVVPLAALPAPVDALGMQVFVDGVLAQQADTGDRQRGAAQLLADVSEFMTLSPGDVLTLGSSAGAPQARAGQSVRVAIDGLGALDFSVVAEEGAA